MTAAEILRRLQRLVDTPPHERPIKVAMLERTAGVAASTVYELLRLGTMTEKCRLRFERALTWLENDQIQVRVPPLHERAKGKKAEITITPPRPPQLVCTRVSFKNGRPTIQRVAMNPKSFPEMEKMK